MTCFNFKFGIFLRSLACCLSMIFLISCGSDDSDDSKKKDSDKSSSNTNSKIIGLQVAAGGNTTCAVMTEDGSVQCLGQGTEGQLGGNVSLADKDQPQFVKMRKIKEDENVEYVKLSGVATIDIGENFGCAIIEKTKSPKCWGTLDTQVLKTAFSLDTEKNVAIDVPGGDSGAVLTDVVQVAVGDTHVCFLMKDTKVKCWGDGTTYQLSNYGENKASVPLFVIDSEGEEVTGVREISAGGNQTCLIFKKDDSVSCFGGSADYATPLPIYADKDDATVLTKVAHVSVGKEHVLLTMKDGGVRAFGKGTDGALGNNKKSNSDIGNTDDKERFTVVVKVAAENSSDVPVPLAKVVRSTAGGNFSCSELEGDTFHCWGNNTLGQLGIDSAVESTIAVPVLEKTGETEVLSNVTQVVAGAKHACGIMKDGDDLTLSCWGAGTKGQLGNALIVVEADSAASPQVLAQAIKVAANSPVPVTVLKEGISEKFLILNSEVDSD